MSEGSPDTENPTQGPVIEASVDHIAPEQGSEQQPPANMEEQPQEGSGDPINLDSTDHGGENTRWDEKKAETLAVVLKEGENVNQVKNHEKDFDTVIDDRDFQIKKSEGVKEDIQAEKDYANEVIDKFLSPYEELYDLNPNTFADMPTSEFMATGKELVRIDKAISKTDGRVEEGKNLKKVMEKGLEERQPVTSDVDHFRMRVKSGIGELQDKDKAKALYDKLKAIQNESFDKTPRETLEGYISLSDEYIALREDLKNAETKRREEFLNKYRPEAAPEPDA